MTAHEETIRVLLADDDEGARNALALGLEHAGFVVHAVEAGEPALRVLQQHQVDCLVTDIHMPGNENLELLASEQVQQGRLAVILITGNASVSTAVRAVRLKADDYLMKPFRIHQLTESIQRAVQAKKADALKNDLAMAAQSYSAYTQSTKQAVTLHHLDKLSSREAEVAKLVAEGCRAEQIGSKLFISPHTVRNHLRAIHKKLDVTSQADLVVRLLRG